MKILIAPDKFKGSLSAQQVCDAIAEGIYSKHPNWSITKTPLADGGEGTSEILTSISGGRIIKCKARDPLFREIDSSFGVSADGKTAFIEMAKASGLQLLKESERDPLHTSSIGTGDLINEALNRGVNKIILGCGGSATNDGGIGMVSALGVSFLDLDQQDLKPIGGNLDKITTINSKGIKSTVSGCKFILLSDVNNPLTGPNGAAFVFGKQKGATDEEIILLDKGLRSFASILNNPDFTEFLGAGAAGGFPVSAKAFLNAEIQSGIQFIMSYSDIESKIKQTDLVITGEGKFDQQSLGGKVIKGLSSICLKYKKPMWVLCGVNEVRDDELRTLGIENVIPLAKDESEKLDAIKNAAQLIKKKIGEEL